MRVPKASLFLPVLWWRNARDVLHDFFHRPGEPHRGMVLRGSAILAARIGQRSSTDADVRLTSDGALRDILRDPQALHSP